MTRRLTAREKTIASEHLHFAIIQTLADNNDFNAIRYLYDRLNIIDAKAQGLLTRNGLLLTVVSIVGSIKLRGDTNAENFLSSAWEQYCFGLGFVLLVTSTLLTFPLVLLRFDNITAVPAAAQLRLENACACHVAGIADLTNCASRLSCRLFMVRELQRRTAGGRSLIDYVDTFIRITLRRQLLLRMAQRSTILASVLFFALIGYVFWQAMDHLHPAPAPPAALTALPEPKAPPAPSPAPPGAPSRPPASAAGTPQ